MKFSDLFPPPEDLAEFYTCLMSYSPHWVVHLVGPPIAGGPMTVLRILIQCEDDMSIVMEKATDYARNVCAVAGVPFHTGEWMCPSLPVKKNCN